MKKVILFLGFSFICLEINSQQNFLNTSFLSAGQWIRIGLTQSGIYKIEASQLSALGLNANPFPTNSLRIFGKKGGNLPEKIDSASLISLTEIPIETGSNYALFYAPGPHAWYYDSVTQTFRFEKNLYSDTAWYFITINSNPINGSLPKRIQTDPASPLPIGKIVRTYTDRYAYENPKSNLLGSGKEWVGENFNANQTTRTFSIPWTNAVSAEPLKLFTHLTSRSLGASAEFGVSLNGIPAQNISLSGVSGGLLDDYAREVKTQTSILHSNLGSVSNLSVQFQYNGISGAEGWLNRFSIQGQKQLIPPNNTQGFYFTITRENTGNLSRDSAAELRISAPLNNGNPSVFPTDTRVWDISDLLNPSIVVSANSGSEITVKTIVEIRKEFACFNPAQALTPIIPNNPNVPNQNLLDLAKGTNNDYKGIIIVHPSLLLAANRLANFHQSQYGYKDLVITTTQCYNEFAAGIPDPAAIRNTLKLFYDNSVPSSTANGKTLQYVVLFGAGTYDPKNILQNSQYNERNLIPTFQSSNSLSPLLSYTSDDFYAMLNNGDDVNQLNDAPLSIAVGRIPVSNLTEANQYINKLIRYHQPNRNNNSSTSNTDNAWRSQLVFIADDKDQNLHLNDAESIAATALSANPALTANKIYLDAYPLISGAGGARYPAVSDAIVNQVLSGALIVNYSGHGNHLRLSEEAVISANEINRFNNPDKLPLFITASCDFDPFDQPGKPSIARPLLYGSNNGAIALLTTTRLVFAYSNRIMNQNFIKAALEPMNNSGTGNNRYLYRSLGEAVRVAKNLSNQSNTQTSGDPLNSRKFALLGDPALQLALPELPIQVNQIKEKNTGNIIPFSDSLIALKTYEISGQVNQPNGSMANDYNGIVSVQFYDQPQQVFTLGNTSESPRTSYSTEKTILFNGKASVQNGQFRVELKIPRDISFGPNKANIKFFAQRSDSTNTQPAAGALPMRIAGNTENNTRDTTGPEIKLYLNDEAFKNGGITHENPVLIAKLFDTSGINATGNGIGHDLVLVLNGDQRNSFLLNSFFSNELNEYQRGTLRYQLAQLPPGKHQLQLKAWDLVNNSNMASLEFTVVNKEQLKIAQVRNFPNPFKAMGGKTVFAFEHNQPNTDLQVRIDIVDAAGASVTQIRRTLNTQGTRNIEIAWDGTTQQGRKCLPGIYYYKLSVAVTGNPSMSTQSTAGQIMIL
ncbi:type IX secretion system sortase PorU [Sediminibacterium sp. C3]|uniref:type IX secretion system sortase PorU n=1 Tax=Sediminibacterium sp. C3 TaxID=1267211 RepID=UPI00040FF90D|nr:type IX secretion system sortase PorU [Sediminibacterium sp. C3]